MKKVIVGLAVVAGLFGCLGTAQAEVTECKDVEVIVNGTKIENQNIPIISENRTLVPLRDLLVALGVENDNEHIIWNDEDRSVVVKKDDTTIKLSIDSNIGYVNGKEVKIDVPAMIYNNRTYLPARFIGEALNKKIGWDAKESSVLVRDMEVYDQVKGAFEKMKEVTNQIKRYGVEIKGKVNSNGVEAPIGLTGKIDAENSKSHFIMNTKILDQAVGIEIYMDGLNAKARLKGLDENGIEQTSEWFSEGLTVDEGMLKVEGYTNIEELLYDYFRVNEELSNDKVLVLENDINFLNIAADLTKALMGESALDGSKINDVKYKYYMDRRTNYLDHADILLDMTVEPQVSEGVILENAEDFIQNIVMEMTMNITDINGKFKVEVE